MFEFIEGHVRMTVESYVDKMDWDEVALVAMIVPSDEGPEHVTEEEYDDVVEELVQAINSQAANEPHNQEIRAMLDEREVDRFERDNDIYG